MRVPLQMKKAPGTWVQGAFGTRICLAGIRRSDAVHGSAEQQVFGIGAGAVFERGDGVDCDVERRVLAAEADFTGSLAFQANPGLAAEQAVVRAKRAIIDAETGAAATRIAAAAKGEKKPPI